MKYVGAVCVILAGVLVAWGIESFRPTVSQVTLQQQNRTTFSVTVPDIRSEVFGPVAPGSVYTTLFNQSALDPRLPSTTPYAVTLSATGDLISAEQISGNAFDFQKQGDDLYSLGRFAADAPIPKGQYVFFNEQHEEEYQLAISSNENTDIHGITRLKNGNYIIPSYHRRFTSASTSIESYVIEEQTPAGKTVFVWDSFDHVSIEEADYTELRTFWLENNITDYFHGNSVAETTDGNLLISGRHTNSIIKIDRTSGAVIWRLGGSLSDFTFVDDPQHGFSHQHSVHQLENGHILLYDNGNLHDPQQTRMVEYELDEVAMTARLVWSYTTGRFTFATGSVQRLSNGNTLIGWGLEYPRMRDDLPRITEINADGEVMMHVYFPADSGFYNAFKL